jgi:hypothetical protein
VVVRSFQTRREIFAKHEVVGSKPITRSIKFSRHIDTFALCRLRSGCPAWNDRGTVFLDRSISAFSRMEMAFARGARTLNSPSALFFLTPP